MEQETKIGHITHRATKELIKLIESLRNAVSKEAGVRLSRSQVGELAIKELAKNKKVLGR